MRAARTTHRGVGAALATALLLLTTTAAARGEDGGGLEAACRARMDELQRQEAKNIESMEWLDRPDGIRGTYVGYNPVYRCVAGSGSEAGASGRMSYQEIVYEKHGSSKKAAHLSVPRPLEIREVTEILVERGGEWR